MYFDLFVMSLTEPESRKNNYNMMRNYGGRVRSFAEVVHLRIFHGRFPDRPRLSKWYLKQFSVLKMPAVIKTVKGIN